MVQIHDLELLVNRRRLKRLLLACGLAFRPPRLLLASWIIDLNGSFSEIEWNVLVLGGPSGLLLLDSMFWHSKQILFASIDCHLLLNKTIWVEHFSFVLNLSLNCLNGNHRLILLFLDFRVNLETVLTLG